MLKRFLPNEYAKSIFDINLDQLKQQGIKGMITDLDNTLVAWDEQQPTKEIIQWVREIKNRDMSVIIASNNNEERVKTFCQSLEIPYIHRARKPLQGVYHRALLKLHLQKEQVVAIGDQLLTDILGANAFGLHTILVVPVARTDGFTTRLNRMIERKILAKMKKKGMIYWEE